MTEKPTTNTCGDCASRREVLLGSPENICIDCLLDVLVDKLVRTPNLIERLEYALCEREARRVEATTKKL
ncbi:MAG: hypothetical protein ACTSPB_25095 [Candidatus Thorarchaeota archaeon]